MQISPTKGSAIHLYWNGSSVAGMVFSPAPFTFLAFFSHAQSGLNSHSGQGLPQITFMSLLFQILDRDTKWNHRYEIEIGQKVLKRGERQITFFAMSYAE